MGSRYVVNKFMEKKGSPYSRFGLRHASSTSTISFANSKATSVHQALKIWFPTKPPMFTIVDIVEQGRVPILCSLKQMKKKPTNAVGYAS